MRITIATALLLFVSITGFAQVQGSVYQPDTSFKVFNGSLEKTIAWSGGFNCPQFATADLNHDGKKDLVVFEKSIGNIKTFINYGTPGNPDYRYRPEFALNFPLVTEYLKLIDYNRDSIPDLICRGYGGISVHKGYYTAANRLSFTYFKDLFYLTQFGWTNAYVEPSDVPGAADVDGDGDLDFFAYDIVGAYINWFKNMQVEDGLPNDSIRIEVGSHCWGKVMQGFTRPQTLGVSCGPEIWGGGGGGATDPLNDPSATTIITPQAKTTLHTGNTLCLLDHDGDGDFDYMNGSISFPDIQYFQNGKADFSYVRDSMRAEDTLWQSNGTSLHLVQEPAAFWLDVDQDGDKDLLFSPHAENSSIDTKNIVYYKNTGSDASPLFTYQSDSFLTDRAIDIGTGSYPMIYDYDKDGKPDLFIGSDGYFNAQNNTHNPRISYFRNTSNGGALSFTLENSDFLSLSLVPNMRGAAMATGDIDNDGMDDMLIGHYDGTITFYKNMAAASTDQPEWQLTLTAIRDANNHLIDSTIHFAAPFIYDIDKDGKKDLLIGYQTGYISYYRNTGTAGQLQLDFQNKKLGLVKADPFNSFSGFSVPYIGRIDNTGEDFMLLGSNSGVISKYTGFQNGNVTTPYTLTDSVYSNIDSTYASDYLKYAGYRSTPAVGDLDGDGKYEMVVGNILGGVNFYKQVLMVTNSIPATQKEGSCSVFPNPARNVVTVSWDPHFAAGPTMEVSIVSLTGQLLKKASYPSGIHTAELSTASLASGMYVMILSSGSHRQTLKLAVMR
jgi:hypothetical protein